MMPNTEDYIQIMIDSLIKKKELLDKIVRKNDSQNECIAGKEYDDIDWDAFNLLIAEKEVAIERINEMDDGFTKLYERVKEQLVGNKDKYADQIRKMQELIGELTDLGVKIQTGEERNRALIEKIMGDRKQVIRKTRNSLNVANSYYQTMKGNIGADYSSIEVKK